MAVRKKIKHKRALIIALISLFTVVILGIFMIFNRQVIQGNHQESFTKNRIQKNILVLLSAHATNPRTAQWLDEINHWGKMHPDFFINLNVVELDVLRNSNNQDWLKEITDELPAIKNHRYDLIITLDNVALESLVQMENLLPARLPVLFSGYEKDPEGLLKIHPNMTGVRENLDLPKNVELGMNLWPDSHEAIILSDSSSDSLLFDNQAKEKLKKHSGLQLTFLDNSKYSMTELFSILREKERHVFLVFPPWRELAKSDYQTRSAMALDLTRNLKIPYLVLTDELLGDGALGGYLVPIRKLANRTTAQASRVLTQESAQGIPVEIQEACPYFDYDVMRKFGVSESALPQGSQIMNCPPGFWKANQRLLWGFGVAFIVFGAAFASYAFALTRSRKRNRLLYASLPGRVGVVNENEKVLYLNTEDGIRDDLKDVKYFRDIPNIIYEKLSDAIKSVFETGKSITVEYEYKSIKRILAASLLEEELFGERAVVWFSQDNTELDKAKHSAEEQAKWLNLTLRSIGDGVITTDVQGRIVMMNPVAARMTGVSQEEAVGKPHDKIFNIVSAINEEPIESPVQRTLRTGVIVELANHTDLLSRDGKRYHIADSAAPIIDDAGQIIGAILVFRDVTEAYESRDKLKKLLTSFEYAADLSNAAAFEIQPESRKLTGSKKIKELWPVTPDDRAVDVHEWVCPEDRKKVDAGWAALLAGEKPVLTVDYRALKDGTIHYYRLKASLDTTDAKSHSIVGVVQDVTEITSSILNLKGDLELWTRVIDTLPVMIFAKDVKHDFRYVQCNQAFYDFCGSSAEAVVGHTDQEILPESADQIHNYDISVSESGKLCHFETEWEDRHGVSHPLKIVKKLFVDPRGRELLIGAATDISELHHVIQNEQALKEALAGVILAPAFEDAFQKIAIILNRLLSCERVVLGRCDDDDGHLHYESEWHKDGMSDLNSHPLECIHQTWDTYKEKFQQNELYVFEENAIRYVNQNYNPSSIRDRMLQSVTAAPIFIEQKYWGSLFVSFIAEKHQFSESDKTLITAMSDILALAQIRERQQLEISETSYRRQTVLDNINMPIWLHAGNGELLWANAKVSEIPDFPSSHLTTEENQKIFCKNLPDDVIYPVAKVIETKQETVTNITFGGRDYATWTRPVLDAQQNLVYIVKSALDITDMNKSVQAQKVLNIGLKTFLAESDMKKAFTLVLEEIQRFFGCTRCYIMHFDAEAQTGTNIAECVAEGYPKFWENIVNCPFSFTGDWLKKADEKRSLVIWPDTRASDTEQFFGSWYPLIRQLKSYYGAALYFEDKFWGILGISFDEYNHALSQPEMDFMKVLNDIFELYFTHAKAERQISAALTQAQNAAKAKSYFLASVSHEIRTPLNAVIGFSELLDDDTLAAAERHEYLHNVIYSGKALLQLINDVLDLSKLESNQMQIILEETDFVELCDEILHLFEQAAHEKNLELRTGIFVQPKLRLDKLRIRQILFNLLGNAVKFTQKGSVTLRAEFTPDNDKTGTLRFGVTDTGIGIAKEDQEKLLEPFVQLSKLRGTNASNNGTGLGLSICKRLIEKMNGELVIESDLGKGSTFSVILHDVEFAGNRSIPADCDSAAIDRPKAANAISILLVDDVPMNLKVMSAMLRKLGIDDIGCAASGEEALALLKKRSFQLVMTDMWMPKMNGAELARAIHALPNCIDLPVVAVTADVEANGNFPMDDFSGVVLKPVTSAKCAEILDTMMLNTKSGEADESI